MMRRRMESEGSSHVLSTEKAGETALRAEESQGREWFAITAFPLFAGTFGPIASALNICALVQPWTCEYSSSTGDVKDIPDPAWLVAINAVSLVFGVVANLTIMFIGAHKGSHAARFSFYLVLVTIIGGSLASVILVILVIIAHRTLRLPSSPDHAFTEAYYYAIMAAGLYFVTSVFIVYTAYMLWQTAKTREGRRELSKKFVLQHRSLKLLTILFLTYLLLGARAFAKIENWRYLDAVFWADVTILTIGFGDFKPATHLGKSLLIPYALVGIFILVLVVYCITQVVFERGKSMWEVRMRDKERIHEIRKREGIAHQRFVILRSNLRGRASSETNDHIIDRGPHVEITADLKEIRKRRIVAEKASRERDFLIMRSILIHSRRRRILYSMGLWLGFAVFLWFFGAVLFYICERDQNWTYFTSIYFTFISLLAIGYGDNTLHSFSGKAVFVLWSLICVPTLTMLISTSTEAIGVPYMVGLQEWFQRRVLGRGEKGGGKVVKELSHTYRSPSSRIRQSQLGHNNHDKNHLRIRAIKSIALDRILHQASNSEPDYSFDDWEYMFYLMDILEPVSDDESSHLTKVRRESEDAQEKADRGERNKERRTGMEEWQDGNQVPDWLHGKNPLNVMESLTEWMLLALMGKLETELADLRRREGNTLIE